MVDIDVSEKIDQTDNIPPPGDPERKQKPGEKWKSVEVHTLPPNNMKLVFPGILLAIFLAALDQTIAAVALPTIIHDIGGQSGYSWVGTAYLLACACMAPLYGKLSDIFGRKPVYFLSMFLFLFGSALCGAAQSFLWLVIARGVQGAGGGGLIQLSMITISDITPLDKRGTYLGIVGSTWGVASVVGPLVGGVLSDHVSWRWCFWINLPTGGVAALILLLFLRLNPTQRKGFRQIISEFDFLGLFLLIAGIACLLVGFNNGQNGWAAPLTIALITVGGILLILGSINEIFTRRSPIIPPRLFKTRTTTGILLSVFLHGIAFFAATYFIPVYFQVLGSSATLAGIKTMAFSLVSSVLAALSGIIVSKTGYRPIIWISWAVMTIGYGLMTQLSNKTSRALQEFFIFIAAVGLGGLFQIPLIALQAAMPLGEMATSTSVYNLLRTLGGTIGISIGGAIYASEVEKKLSSIPNYHPPTGFQLTNNVQGLVDIQPADVRDAVLHAYTSSISLIWVVMTPIVFVGFLCVLPIRSYSLKRTIVQTLKHEHPKPSKADEEAQLERSDAPTNDSADGRR